MYRIRLDEGQAVFGKLLRDIDITRYLLYFIHDVVSIRVPRTHEVLSYLSVVSLTFINHFTNHEHTTYSGK